MSSLGNPMPGFHSLTRGGEIPIPSSAGPEAFGLEPMRDTSNDHNLSPGTRAEIAGAENQISVQRPTDDARRGAAPPYSYANPVTTQGSAASATHSGYSHRERPTFPTRGQIAARDGAGAVSRRTVPTQPARSSANVPERQSLRTGGLWRVARDRGGHGHHRRRESADDLYVDETRLSGEMGLDMGLPPLPSPPPACACGANRFWVGEVAWCHECGVT